MVCLRRWEDQLHSTRSWLQGEACLDKMRITPVTFLKIQEGKKAMNHFAQHKIQMHAPTVLGPNTNMLLKAEARTVTALMNSKSAAQTRQILVAAYRRAGLSDPFQAQSQEAPSAHPPLADITRDLNDMRQALLNQVEITQTIAETMKDTPKAQNFDLLAAAFSQAQKSMWPRSQH